MMGKVSLRDFGSTGRRVAAVGQGSWRAEETGAAAVIASLRRGIDLGMTTSTRRKCMVPAPPKD